MNIVGRMVNGLDRLEFRSVPAEQTSFMVAAVTGEYDPSGSHVAGDEKFAFDLNDLQHIRRVDNRAWESAKPVSLHQRPVEGKFPRAGTDWVNKRQMALGSPSDQWIALQSFTPGRAPLFRIDIFRNASSPPIDGTFFVEILDSRVAHRVGSVELGVTGEDFIALSYRTGWLSDNHLIVAGTHPEWENFAVCSCKPRK